MNLTLYSIFWQKAHPKKPPKTPHEQKQKVKKLKLKLGEAKNEMKRRSQGVRKSGTAPTSGQAEAGGIPIPSLFRCIV
jgi:hypothetical protein